MQALLNAIAQLPWVAEAQRLFHGRGGLHPGSEDWTLDAYPPAWVLTCFGPVSDAHINTLHTALHTRWQQVAPPGQPLCWVLQQRNQALRLAARSHTQLMAGELPQPHWVHEAGAQYTVQVLRGQNHGLFLDTAAARHWVRQHCAQFAARHGRAPRVLNLFAYSGGFSVAALQGGAGQVINIDMAEGPLALARRNHQQNGLMHGALFWAHDIFHSWAKISRHGPYDLLIADPPSYQKGSFIARKDYARLLRRVPALLAPGGQALLCLNAPELPASFLPDLAATEAPALRLLQRLPNPAAFADADENRSLKAQVFGLDVDTISTQTHP